MKRTTFVLLTVTALSSVVSYAGAAVRYQVVELGVYGGGSSSQAYAINNSGWVVGSWTDADGKHHSFLWRDGCMQDLGLLPGSGDQSGATDINDSGQIVGFTYGGSGIAPKAYVWQNGSAAQLGNPIPNYSTLAYGINSAGLVVGEAGGYGAVTWQSGSVTVLPSPTGWITQFAYAANAQGDVVGTANRVGSGLSRAVAWVDGQMMELDPAAYSSVAGDINDSGTIVGYRTPEGQPQHACVWQEDAIIDLGTLGGNNSVARCINNLGQVVGEADSATRLERPFLWDKGIMTDLNDLIAPDSQWDLQEAYAINDRGQIVGAGWKNGQFHGVLLNPIPEPSSLLAVLSGVMGTAGLAWRRNQSRKR